MTLNHSTSVIARESSINRTVKYVKKTNFEPGKVL